MSWNNQPPPPPHQQPYGGEQQPFTPPPPPSGRPGWARKRIVIPSAAVLFFFGVAVGTSGNGTENTSSAEPAPTVTKTVTAQPQPSSADTADDKPAKAEKPKPQASAQSKAVPDFTGMGLQSAQDTAQAKGFYSLTSHDSSGRDRLQALDRNWKVCSQSPAAGKVVPVDTELDFGAVKLEETCPAKDVKAPKAAGNKMPNLAGKSVNTARGALDSGTSITVTDASPADRMVLLESNWRVCSQSPGPGTTLKGQPVTFTAVKYEENCP